MLGIIGAMEIEINGLKEKMTDVRTRTISGIPFSTGKLFGVECVAAVCGIGKVNAAMCAQTMILTFQPDYVLNTGVAGGMGKGIRIGDLVVASDVVQHDMDTSAVGDPKGFLSGIDLVHIPCSQRLVDQVLAAADGMEDTQVHTGTIVTGDQFINDRDTLNRLMTEFGGIACEMEGGSIGQVCCANGVAFAVVRAISDNANDDSHIDYPQFVGIAAKKSIQLVSRLAQALARGTAALQ